MSSFRFHKTGTRVSAHVKWLLLLVGIGVFLGVKAVPHYIITSERVAIREPDDSYGYILKAVQMEECFFQDCAALRDLREQLSVPNSRLDVSRDRLRQHHRVLDVYTPLHSAILLGLHKAGMTLESAYNAMALAGYVIMAIAVAFFLANLFGVGPASIGLLLVALTKFQNQSLFNMNPSSMSLAVLLLVMTAIISEWKHQRVAIIAGILIMLGLHPIGKIYTVISLLIYCLLEPRPWRHGTKKTLAAGIGILGIISSLPLFLDYPRMTYFPPGWPRPDLLTELTTQLRAVFLVAGEWFRAVGGWSVAIMIMVLGAILVPPERWRKVIVTIGVVGLACAGSLFYIIQDFPAEIFTRLWILFAICSSGLIGLVGWRAMTTVAELAHPMNWSHYGTLTSNRFILSPRGWMALAVVGLSLHFVQFISSMGIGMASNLPGRMAWAKNWHNFSFDANQPLKMLEASGKDDAVAYSSEYHLYYYLTYGALHRKAVYVFPGAVWGASLESRWLQNNIKFATHWNPVRAGRIQLGAGGSFMVERPEEGRLSDIFLKVENLSAREATVRFTPKQSALKGTSPPPWESTVPASTTLWLRLTPPLASMATHFKVSSDVQENTLFVSGLKVSETATLNWPWDTDIAIQVGGADKTVKPIRFRTDKFSPWLGRDFEMIDDSGSIVLARVVQAPLLMKFEKPAQTDSQ